MTDKVIIFDTTMRDGEQSPGASMTADEKVRIAKMLEKMRVNVMEAGFAAASPGDFLAVEAVAKNVKESIVCSLSRAVDADIEKAAQAIKAAPLQRIHTFIATSPIHMEYKLKMHPDKVLEQAVHAVKKAKSYVSDVEFSCEDASRSELDFLCRIIEATIDAGATTINIPDTVGYAIPDEFAYLIKQLLEKIPNSDKAIFSVHCHNDLGLAVANSLAAMQSGARQLECTINGLGERAGNASLEEIVMSIKTRGDYLNTTTDIDSQHLLATSRLVSSITGFAVQPNKAIVGKNAFAHESGIHQDGILKHRETYEIMRAEDVGWNANSMVLGKHSGRNAFKSRLEELGIKLDSEQELNQVFASFKNLADKKHEIFDEDLHALVSDNFSFKAGNYYQLITMEVQSKTGEVPLANVILDVEGKELSSQSEGSGPIDAVFKAIDAIAKSEAQLELYSVNAITAGTDSQGEVTVRLNKGGRIVNGLGADVDIVKASAKAYVNALNMLKSSPNSIHPQEGI